MLTPISYKLQLLKKIFLSFIFILLSAFIIKAQVIINEIMAYNTSGIINPDLGICTDWIEIYNTGEETFDLSSSSLSDNRNDLHLWNFPLGTTIGPGDFLVIWADRAEEIQNGLHAGFKLDLAGETVYLSGQTGSLLDSLSFTRQFENVSYGKNDTSGYVYFSNPTPGTGNDQSSAYRLAAGIFYDPPPGIYANPQTVKLSWYDTNAVIHYTLDGSEPDENSDVCTGTLNIPNNTVIRTRIWADGYLPGWIETATYFIGDTFTLPVFSLVTDPVNLWDDIQGIYVEGTNGITGYCSEEPRNWNQDWERPVSLEYFGISGQRILQSDGGIKISGGCSRLAPMKSLAFFTRNEYGANELRYPFFQEKKDVNWFKDLVFRNSGNDFQYTMMRDGIIQAVVKDQMDIDAQAFEPVQVFLNGEYWGIHNLREKINEHYIISNYDLPADEVDFIKNRHEVFSGTDEAYRSLVDFLETNHLSSQENYNHVAERIDIKEYMNYLITQMFFANRDWPGNNLKYWRHRPTEGKWRWILYDLDFAMGIYQFDPAIDMFTFATADTSDNWPNPAWSTLLLRRLLENDGFRDQFTRRYMMHLNTTFQPYKVVQVIDSIYGMVSDVFPTHIARWQQPSTMDQWMSNIEQLRNFAHLRPDFVWQNMTSYFSLGSEIFLAIEYPDTAGTIILNEFNVPPGGFQGRFVPGYPLDIQVFPASGNKFIRWEITPGELIKDTILSRQSVWKYYDAGGYPGNEWNTSGFNDSSWMEGPGELGYGDGSESTILNFGPDPENKFITYYFRKEIELESPPKYTDYSIHLMRDDGAIIYINGAEVLRVNMPEGDIGFETTASNYVGGADENTYYKYFPDTLYLQSGTNIIAVEIHQSGPASSDISFDMELTGSYFISGDPVQYEGTRLSITPTEGVTIHPVFLKSEELPNLVINEFMASNQDAYEDEFGEDADWIELFNTEQFDVNISGYYFTDNLGQPFKWQIPAGFPEITTIQAGGYIVLFADRDTLQGPIHLDIKLAAEGEEIGLSAIVDNKFYWIDTITFGPQITNVSFGRYPDGAAEWKKMYQYTPGTSNLFTSVPVISRPAFRLDVYPNPAGDVVYLQITGLAERSSGRFEVSLYDLIGRIILTNEIWISGTEYSGSINLSKVPQGFYILKVGNDVEQISTRLIRK